MKGLYYISNADGQLHNLYDANFSLHDGGDTALILSEYNEVIDEVGIFSYEVIITLIK